MKLVNQIYSIHPINTGCNTGNDAAENLGILIEDKSWFIVKRNLRRGESKEEWLAKVKECCKDIRNPRDGKTVYIGSSWKDVAYTDSEGTSKTITMRIVYEVIDVDYVAHHYPANEEP